MGFTCWYGSVCMGGGKENTQSMSEVSIRKLTALEFNYHDQPHNHIHVIPLR